MSTDNTTQDELKPCSDFEEPWEYSEKQYSEAIMGRSFVDPKPGRPKRRKVLIAQFGLYTDDETNHEAFARRAIQCVNACAGIPDPGAAIKAARDVQWNPITTAPKDCYVIIHRKSGRICIARYDTQEFHSRPNPFWNDHSPFGTTRNREDWPTHWMPIPDAPALAQLPAETKEGE